MTTQGASFEKNQTKSKESKGRGGKRANSGRKTGSATKRTREIADKAAAEGVTPLEFLLEIMREAVNEPRDRMAAAIAAAPYIHPRLAAVEHTGADGGAMVHRIEQHIVDPQG